MGTFWDSDYSGQSVQVEYFIYTVTQEEESWACAVFLIYYKLHVLCFNFMIDVAFSLTVHLFIIFF